MFSLSSWSLKIKQTKSKEEVKTKRNVEKKERCIRRAFGVLPPTRKNNTHSLHLDFRIVLTYNE